MKTSLVALATLMLAGTASAATTQNPFARAADAAPQAPVKLASSR